MPIPAQNTKTIYNYITSTVVPFVITNFIFDSQSKFSVSLNNINIVSTITSDANLNKVIFTPPLSIPSDSILVVSLNTPIARVDFIDPSNIDKVAINSQLNQFTLLIQQVNTNLKNIIHYQEDIVPPRDDLTFPSLDNNKIFYKNNSGVIGLLDYAESAIVTTERNKYYDKQTIYYNPTNLNSSQLGSTIIFTNMNSCNIEDGTELWQFYNIVQQQFKITFTGTLNFNNIRYGKTEYFLIWNGLSWSITTQQSYIFAIGYLSNSTPSTPLINQTGYDPYELFITNNSQFKCPLSGTVLIELSFSNILQATLFNSAFRNLTQNVSYLFNHEANYKQSVFTFISVNKNDILDIIISVTVATDIHFKYTYLPIGHY